jgi:8-oxo-dGTP pyrophosphatase MutT (NUDIX family)
MLRSRDWCNIIPVTEDGRIVLVRQYRIGTDSFTLEVPGGVLDPEDKDIQAAALREMEEETGCQVEIIRKVALYTPKNRLSKITHFYEVKLKSGFLKTGNETKDLQFFSLSALPKHLPPPYAHWIADAAARHPHTLHKDVAGVSYPVLFKLLLQHPLLVGRFLLTKIGIHINEPIR